MDATYANEWWERLKYVHSSTGRPLQRDEIQGFLDWLLDEEAIAKRGSKRLQKGDNRMVGKYICRSPDNMRKDDFRERLYVAFEALRQSGRNKRDSCLELCEVRSVRRRLEWSRPLNLRPEAHDIAETIRSSVTRFLAPLRHTLLERWVGLYRLYQICAGRGLSDN